MSAKKSIHQFIELKEDADTSEIVDHIMDRLGQGASSPELIAELKIKYKISPQKAKIMLDVITDVAFRLDPNYVAEVAGQIRYSIQKTLQGIDQLIQREPATSDQKDLLRMRLHAAQALQKLLPTQISLGVKDDDGLRGALFDLHGIDKKDDHDND